METLSDIDRELRKVCAARAKARVAAALSEDRQDVWIVRSLCDRVDQLLDQRLALASCAPARRGWPAVC